MHLFPYKWYLKDGYPSKNITKNNYNVFGTFICGGGSTMGYKLAGFNHLGGVEIDPKISEVLNTITSTSGTKLIEFDNPNHLSNIKLMQCGSYPLDYNFKSVEPKYLIGMSVPPVMTAQISNQIKIQWLDKMNL